MGDDVNAPHMERARELILRRGGAEKCNTFTKFYFAALGQISFDACPAIPPEIVFLPKWFYFNLYNVSAWTRTMILPLGIVTTLKPVRALPADRGIAELYIDHDAANRLGEPASGLPRNWNSIFLKLDKVLKTVQSIRRSAGCATAPSRPPKSGCSIILRDATAWGRSFRRWCTS